MNHIDILKRAFQITWRYRALWMFGFFLALCGGGGGGGGGSNFNFPSSGGSGDFDDFGDIPNVLAIDPNVIIALAVGIILLIICLTVLSVIVQVVTRTALMGMVRQITEIEAVTIADGWRLGWSRRAWRLFLLGLVIGIPFAVVVIILFLLALSPLFLLLADNTALAVVSIIITVFTILFVILILIIVGVLVSVFQELAWRRVVLDGSGVIACLGETFGLIKRHPKDITIVWALMLGVGIAWAFVSIFVVLVSFFVAALVGGIPALVVYLISESVIGAAIAGGPLAFVVIILISSIITAFYLIFQSTVWTLAYLEIQALEKPEGQETREPDSGQTAALPGLPAEA